jgi:hypothetical protein
MGLAGVFSVVAGLTACRRRTCDSGWAERLQDLGNRKKVLGGCRMYRYMRQSCPELPRACTPAVEKPSGPDFVLVGVTQHPNSTSSD